jgi:hypothetical protein
MVSAWRAGLVAAVMAAAACGGGEEPAETRFEGPEVEQARASWPEGLAPMVDSGNAAMRAGHMDEAADVFRRATERYPHVATAWFGLYMAEHGRGRIEAGDSALLKARSLTPGLAPTRPGADSAGGMPAGSTAVFPGHPGTGGR